MAFLRYAKSTIVKPKIFGHEWENIRVASKSNRFDYSLKTQAEKILGESFTPEKYLLTHSTIVCSVDTESVKGSKTGSTEYDGEKINRRYADFRVLSSCDKYINNNLDCWSRGVIKKAFKTFIGSDNFVEHIQVAELSKGKIIDAVLRDIGDSLYVDILVATNKKHTDLVNQILSGEMNAMSMGCSVDYTICTKCGNVASDETEMCKHIKYEKGNVFYDEKGQPHRVAELCGHESEDPTGGVTFIEASWVATPAFVGAVARNTIDTPSSFDKKLAQDSMLSKTASYKFAFDFDDGGDSGSEDSGADKKEETPKSMIDELEDSVKKVVLDRIKTKIEQEITDSDEQQENGVDLTKSTVHENDTVIKEGSEPSFDDMSDEQLDSLVGNVFDRLVQQSKQQTKTAYFNHLRYAVSNAQNNAQAIQNIAYVNKQHGINLSKDMYKLAHLLGKANLYDSLKTFLSVANTLSNRPLNYQEQENLVKLAKILSLRK